MAPADSQFDPQANVDAEIRHIGDDRLGRAPFARRVAERIGAAGNRPSIVYGLAGAWGGGKSSILNMVEELMTEEPESKWSVVRFTPWAAGDVDALTDDFYRAIAEAMPHETEQGKTARRLLLAAAPVVLAAAKAAAIGFIESKLGKGTLAQAAEAAAEKLADEAGEITVDPDPFVKRFTRLSSAIEQAGRNILVIVDDIDRLHADELLSVMKAVRLLGRFDHVHYFLSYDEDTVLDVLEESDLAKNDRRRARQYMEKIVQYPFVLPPLDPVHFESELSAALRLVADVHAVDLNPESRGQLRDSIAAILDAIPDPDIEELTPRFIYRFASQIDTLITLVGKDELNFEDAALVTYLRMMHPEIYKRLPHWRTDLVGGGRRLFRLFLRASGNISWSDRIAQAMHIDGVTDEGKLQVEAMQNLLGTIFPRVSHRSVLARRTGANRIYEPDYFARYFAYAIPVGDVSDGRVRTEFGTLIESGALPEDSVIAENLRSLVGRGLVRRKVSRNLDLVTAASSLEANRAAHYLVALLGPSDYDGYDVDGWGNIIYALLGQAICATDGNSAVHIVESFEAKFGLFTTSLVLLAPRSRVGVDHSRVIEASVSVRQAVLALCKKDLTSDVLAGDRDALTLLHFIPLIDDDMRAQLRTFAMGLLAEGKAKPYELAARFVRIGETQERYSDPTEDQLMDFLTVVPHELWDVDQIPRVEEGDVSATDSSLENRIKYAAFVMKSAASEHLPDSSESSEAQHAHENSHPG
jgi:predicted KAP-like P-loop ATPase